jgi:hypothetical protein
MIINNHLQHLFDKSYQRIILLITSATVLHLTIAILNTKNSA